MFRHRVLRNMSCCDIRIAGTHVDYYSTTGVAWPKPTGNGVGDLFLHHLGDSFQAVQNTADVDRPETFVLIQ